MRNSPTGKRVYAVAILSGICVPVAVLSAAQIQSSGTGPASVASRVLHFPKDQCVGVLHMEDHSPRSEYAQHNFDPSLP